MKKESGKYLKVFCKMEMCTVAKLIFIPDPFSGESSSGNHSVEEMKHFSSERRRYTEDDVDNSS